MSQFVTSLIRTWTPIVVGWLLSLPITPALLDLLGVSPDQANTALTGAVTAVLAGAYYLAVRLVEYRWPSLGRLLGSAKKPVYGPLKEVPQEWYAAGATPLDPLPRRDTTGPGGVYLGP
jgi:hypothetical protein